MDKYDMNNDGIVSRDELETTIRIKDHRVKLITLKDRSKMAWVALFGMVYYPLLIVLCSIFGFDTASSYLSDITGVYFGSIAVVVATYMGSEAYITSMDSK